MIMKKAVLITGGAGYIGSHVGYFLHQQGYQIIILDEFIHAQPTPTFTTVIRGSINNLSLLQKTLTSYPIDAVIHCAALCDVADSTKNPLPYYQTNVNGMVTLLDTMARAGVYKLIFSSSCAVYGEPETIPIPEEHFQRPISPYGKTKMIDELVIKDCAQIEGINAMVFRYFNVAGAMPEYGLCEWHVPEIHLIPRLLLSAYEGIPFTIYGNDYDTADGTAIRDYIHVWDIAIAHSIALKKLDQGYPSDTFNIGLGKGYSVKEIVAMVERVTKKNIPINYDNPRAGDPAQLIADSTRAYHILGWKPRFSELPFIIQSAFNALQNVSATREHKIITKLV